MQIEHSRHQVKAQLLSTPDSVQELQKKKASAGVLLSATDEAAVSLKPSTTLEPTDTYDIMARRRQAASDALQKKDSLSPNEDEQGPPSADLNGDGVVDEEDLMYLLKSWGMSDSPADFNGDGTVDVSDLLYLLSQWTMPETDSKPDVSDNTSDTPNNSAMLRRRRWAASQPSEEKGDAVDEAHLRRRRFAASQNEESDSTDLRRLMASRFEAANNAQIRTNRSVEDLLSVLSEI